MIELVERRLYSVHFKAKEWIEYGYGPGAVKLEIPIPKIWGPGHYRISVAADSLEEAANITKTSYAKYRADASPVLIDYPKFEGVTVQTISRKAAYFVPRNLRRGQAYRGYYSFSDQDRPGFRDNGSVFVVAESWEQAQQIIKDYAEQEENVVIHTVSYDGEVFCDK